MDTFAKQLEVIVGAGNVRLDEPMSAHTTFRIGGPADYFVTPGSSGELAGVLARAREAGIASYVLGRGSNVLVADGGLRGVVVQLAGNFAAIQVPGDGRVRAQAGVSNAKLAAEACRAGLAGFEFAAGIPGTVGGAAIMNAGAYGGELKDVAVLVSCIDSDGRELVVPREEAGWGYRSSAFAARGLVVTGVELALSPDDPARIQARMDDLARRRQDKQPLDKPSAGSTFKRPPGNFAGKLIQDAGMQGYRVGGAQVSPKHAGFVVNAGGASAADVRQVIDDVRAAVAEAFGVELECEVRFWGFGQDVA